MMTRDEKRLYLVGKCLCGAAHRSPSRASAASMATRAIEIADGVLDVLDAPEAGDVSDRHDTIPMPARGPDDAGPWEPLRFHGEETEKANGNSGSRRRAASR